MDALLPVVVIVGVVAVLAIGAFNGLVSGRNRVDEAKLARELADAFRANYRRAEAIARGEAP